MHFLYLLPLLDLFHLSLVFYALLVLQTYRAQLFPNDFMMLLQTMNRKTRFFFCLLDLSDPNGDILFQLFLILAHLLSQTLFTCWQSCFSRMDYFLISIIFSYLDLACYRALLRRCLSVRRYLILFDIFCYSSSSWWKTSSRCTLETLSVKGNILT